jgi:hypothetical protein
MDLSSGGPGGSGLDFLDLRGPNANLFSLTLGPQFFDIVSFHPRVKCSIFILSSGEKELRDLPHSLRPLSNLNYVYGGERFGVVSNSD